MLLVDNGFMGLSSISMTTVNLRSGENQGRIMPLQSIAFSPDGTMIVYYDWQERKGHITNLYNDEEKEYAWSKGASHRISWLTGSDLIAYDSDDGIYISHVDGTGLYKVNGTDGETLLSGWLPDGQHLLVSRTSYKSPMLLQMIDITNGGTKDLFSFSSSYVTAAMPSPDGKKVLFEDTVTGTQQQGIFVANLDGSERHLITSFWLMQIGSYTWSPDGKWVIISVTDVKHGIEITNFLINLDSCETVRLSSLDWAVRAWGIKP
jgi:Tol biopolymer transport system component